MKATKIIKLQVFSQHVGKLNEEQGQANSAVCSLLKEAGKLPHIPQPRL
jgi:hypothetical protein